MMALKKADTRNGLLPKDLRWMCNPAIFDFQSTGELEPIEGTLGQDRALNAIKLGVNLRSPGYNIYISGLSGTGKATTVKKILEKTSENTPSLKDYAYVNNFSDPDRPILLVFPAGNAKIFKQELNGLILFLKEKILFRNLFQFQKLYLEKQWKAFCEGGFSPHCLMILIPPCC